MAGTSKRVAQTGARTWIFVLVVKTIVFAMALTTLASAQELIFSTVRLQAPTVPAGAEIEVEIELVDASGTALPAPADYAFVLEVRRGSHEGNLVAAYELTLPAGSSTTSVPLTLSEIGIMSLRALSDATLAREAFLRVVEADRSRLRHGDTVMRSWWLGTAQAAPQPRARGGAPYRLEILYDATTSYLANGEDAAQLQLFLYDREGRPTRARQDIEVRLVTNRGILKPPEVVIPKGEDGITVLLSAKRPGPVTLTYRGAIPGAALLTPELPPVTFASNILYISASPTRTSLLQPLELVIRLYGADGQPVPADSNRLFTVEIADGSRGRGVFKPAAQATIEQGNFETRIDFVPNWIGNVLVSASSPNLQSATVEIQVAMALIWILLSSGGGALGSVVALLFGPKVPVPKRFARVLAGIVAGFAFFWALVYGVLVMPSVDLILLNPISAVMVSFLGGYAGTSVFSLLLKSFGVTTTQP